MSATPPSNLVGTQSPGSFEVLWERYKSLIMTIIAALLLALVGNYAWQYSEQKAVDEKWSEFSANLGLEETYTDSSALFKPMDEILEDLEWSALEAAMNGSADWAANAEEVGRCQAQRRPSTFRWRHQCHRIP